LNTLLRFVQYLAKRVIILAIIISLAVLAAFIAYDCANIYIVITEGMTLRATAILEGQENIVLNKFFTQSYLNADPLMNNNVYEDFIIQDYNIKMRVKWLWAWPWEDKVKVVIEESIPKIVGKPKDDEQAAKTPPAWQNGEKIVLLEKIDSYWKIAGVIFKSYLD